jgi:hypothetical protein
MEPEQEQNRSEAQREPEWELSDLELDRSEFGRGSASAPCGAFGGCATACYKPLCS